MVRPWRLPVTFPLEGERPFHCEVGVNGLFVVYLENRPGSTTTIGGGQVEMICQRYVTTWRDSTIIPPYESQILERINGELGEQ